jgi:hypothetical protein
MLAQDLPLRADRVVGGRERIGRRLLQPGSLNLIRTRSGIALTLGRAEGCDARWPLDHLHEAI